MNSLDSYLQGPPTGSLSFTSPLEVHCQRCYVLQFLKDAPFSSYSPLHVVALVQIGRSSECQSLPQSCQCPLLLGIKPLFCLGRVIISLGLVEATTSSTIPCLRARTLQISASHPRRPLTWAITEGHLPYTNFNQLVGPSPSLLNMLKKVLECRDICALCHHCSAAPWHWRVAPIATHSTFNQLVGPCPSLMF